MSTVLEVTDEAFAPLSTEPGELSLHQWTISDYYKMFEAGLFEGKQVELLEGQVVEMSAMGTEHATAVLLAESAIKNSFSSVYHVRTQMVFQAHEKSEPQPDLAVVKGKPRDYKTAHPTEAALIVEAADSSLRSDRTIKASIYAKAGVKEYWIINLVARRLEVYRSPSKIISRHLGFGYSEIKILAENDTIKPLAAKKEVTVADLLP